MEARSSDCGVGVKSNVAFGWGGNLRGKVGGMGTARIVQRLMKSRYARASTTDPNAALQMITKGQCAGVPNG